MRVQAPYTAWLSGVGGFGVSSGYHNKRVAVKVTAGAATYAG